MNTLHVITSFEIGRRIVEHEQKGAKRAEYGAELLKELSARLTEEFGKGFSAVNLSLMQRFFLIWKDRVQIFQKPSKKLHPEEISQKPSAELAIAQTTTGQLIPISANPARESPFPLRLKG